MRPTRFKTYDDYFGTKEVTGCTKNDQQTDIIVRVKEETDF